MLGIGNDEPLCDAAAPPLSSVAIELANQGYRAARELHALILGGRSTRADIRFGAAETVARFFKSCRPTITPQEDVLTVPRF